MFDMNKMMGKIKEVQDKMQEVQKNLVNIKASGEAGGGMVYAEANGLKKIEKITVDESLLVKEDKEMMQDLIVAAVNKALEGAEEKSKEEVQKHTSGMLPNIPGFNFGNFGGQ
jgi:hypothetical protein